MAAVDWVKPALVYVDAHLEESLRLEDVAAWVHFSPYYFHRVFSLVAGKPLAGYIRARRLEFACQWLVEGEISLSEIAARSGFETDQAFSRAFRRAYGMPPGAFRQVGICAEPEPIEARVRRFLNRLEGGKYMKPKILNQGAMVIAGAKGPGNETAEVWAKAEARCAEHPVSTEPGGYEVRLWDGEENPVWAGWIKSTNTPEHWDTITLPAGTYASFEVLVADGYMSQNDAMQEWLASNEEGWKRRMVDGTPCVVEFYDARFNGEESGSIVEIWVPVEK